LQGAYSNFARHPAEIAKPVVLTPVAATCDQE